MAEAHETWTRLLENGARAWAAGQSQAAEQSLLLGLSDAQKSGVSDARVAAGMDVLADVYRSGKMFPLAETLYERSLAIRESLLGREDSLVAKTLCALGHVYMEQGAHDKAEVVCKRAAGIWEKHLQKQALARRKISSRRRKLLTKLPTEDSVDSLSRWAEEFASQAAKMAEELVSRTGRRGVAVLEAAHEKALASSLTEMSSKLRSHAGGKAG